MIPEPDSVFWPNKTEKKNNPESMFQFFFQSFFFICQSLSKEDLDRLTGNWKSEKERKAFQQKQIYLKLKSIQLN